MEAAAVEIATEKEEGALENERLRARMAEVRRWSQRARACVCVCVCVWLCGWYWSLRLVDRLSFLSPATAAA